MKLLEEINTTFREVLDHNPKGAYIYKIMFETLETPILKENSTVFWAH